MSKFGLKNRRQNQTCPIYEATCIKLASLILVYIKQIYFLLNTAESQIASRAQV
jgi:hypothetical protein